MALPAHRPSIEEMNERRRSHRRYRAEWLLGLEAGALTIADVIEQAEAQEGAPLRSLKVRDILTTTNGSPTKSNRILNWVLKDLGVDIKTSAVRVQWLIDKRSGARRMVALADAMVRVDRTAPTRTWPW